MTEEQFNEAKSQHDAIIPWRNVPEGVIYRIVDVEEITTSKGPANVLGLVDANGEILRAFTTSILDRDLADLNWSGSCYIKSLGLKQTASSDR